jgi:hypothetical protein
MLARFLERVGSTGLSETDATTIVLVTMLYGCNA